MKTTKRYTLNNNILELYVKKSPPIGRGFLLFLAFVMVALPILGMVLNFIDGNAFHFGYLMGLGLFTLVAFYFVRLFLWNTYGKEVIEIVDSTVSYYVDYHYFKGNQKVISYEGLTYSIVPIGFEEEQVGNLVISASESDYIESGVNMDISELVVLVEELERFGL
ncbi:hypothetical protein [uncultured Flavobacterium sp.]|uniref:hypothetical protein n=1 Tax=uncultured Flavobacterium sp. TaxID=165435 RepID=UPI0030EC973F